MKYCKNTIALSLLAAIFIVGCAQGPKSANSGEAIKHADTLQTVEEKVEFLASEANAFLNSEEFDEAIKTAKYILSKLDGNSQEAQGIIDQAKTKLEAMAKEKAEELKGDIKGKLGSFGK